MASTTLSSRSRAAKAARTMTLALSIDHQVYSIERLSPSDNVILKAYRLSKRGGDGAVYDCASTLAGHQCDCPDWTFRRDGLTLEPCKHLAALTHFGLFPPPMTPPAPPVPVGEILPAIVAPAPACCAPAESAPCATCEAPAVEPEDEDAGDPATWPAWVDSWYWAPGPAPSEAGPAGEPSPADRRWAAQHLDTARRRGRSAVCPQISDEDHILAGHGI